MTRTILYLPPNDRPDVLAPSVGGGMVPVMHRRLLSRTWRRTRAYNDDATALLLSLNGTPDAIGMGRARDVLADLDGGGSYDGTRFKRGAVMGTWCLFGDDYGRYGHFVTYSQDDGWLPGIPLLNSEMELPHALATILAAGIGGSVVVVDG